MASEIVRRLIQGQRLSREAAKPVFAWAIHEAIEAEYRARYASDQALCSVDPVYPTVVELLAAAVAAVKADHDA